MNGTDFSYSSRIRIEAGDAAALLQDLAPRAALVVTSPPYPMIAMWDELFEHSPEADRPGMEVFEAMHAELDRVWAALAEALIPGGIACINIGDALRTWGDEFGLYPNASRITMRFCSLGFTPLPRIIWRKSTNAPNKFMGSGMLPGGAYVTLEHEHILIFRKGGKRRFQDEESKVLRRRSAYFWEERNRWFSDLWDLAGERQLLKRDASRERSAAFPLELAYRLISMYSLQGDLVVDPYLGTGTAALAAAAAGRSFLGCELDHELAASALDLVADRAADTSASIARERLKAHRRFVEEYTARKAAPKYVNSFYDLPVITAQERELILPLAAGVGRRETCIEIEQGPAKEECNAQAGQGDYRAERDPGGSRGVPDRPDSFCDKQLALLDQHELRP